MEEELFFIVFMIAANAILWIWQFIVYLNEERGKRAKSKTSNVNGYGRRIRMDHEEA